MNKNRIVWSIIIGCFLLFGLLVSGCSTGPAHYHHVKVGEVTGDVWARKLGSRAQMEGGKNQIGIGVPIDGIPVRVDAEGTAPILGTIITIDKVGGSLYIEEALVGTQNVNIPEAFRALYKNANGDPFAFKTGTEEEIQ